MPSSDTLTARQALIALSALPRLGPVTIRRLLAAFDNDPLAILRAPVARLSQVERVGMETAQIVANWHKHTDPLAAEVKLARAGVDFVSLLDADYPPPLKHIYDPPVGLYSKGPLRPGVKSVGIVGSRRTTLYGQSTAQMLGRELAALGFCVISGMARGIDTAAHKGALSVGGQTVAVLGNGVDIVYPPENIDLYQQIAAQGAVVSELPLGTRASRTTFPMRNRLISGMSAAVIVVETDKQGGSMITARFAAEHNRLLFAVPGRIDSSTSQGCNQLIREGAILLSSVDDLIEELAYGGANRGTIGGLPQVDDFPDAEGEDDEATDYSGQIVTESLPQGAADARETFDARAAASVLGVAGVQSNVQAPQRETISLFVADTPATEVAQNTAKPTPEAAGLGANEIAVLGVLRAGDRMDRDSVARAVSLPVGAVSASLLLLELRKFVVKRADGTFEAYGQGASQK